MNELINRVTITGKLVKNNIEEFQTRKGEDAIGGSLVLRTADNSEHDVRFFAFKYKRDENKNFTSEESYFYQKYIDAKENLKDIEHCADGEHPDIISITDGMFMDNDFKGNDGKVVSSNTISARFINRVEPKDYESTVLEAKFEVEGIIEKIDNEVVKGIPTGNILVVIDAIGQTANGFGKDSTYTVDHLIPIKMVVDKSLKDGFMSAGYYEGGFVKFAGKVINSVDIVTQTEKVAFGNDIERVIKTEVRKNEIKSGLPVSTIFEHGLTQDIVEALKAKRKAKLAEIESGITKPAETESQSIPKIPYNPFAQN